MNYVYFIKNLPLEIIEIINSFVNPKTDFYRERLKEKVKLFCLDGLMRIEDNGIKINHSYFHKKEFLGEFEEEKKFRLNIDKNIDKILQVRDILKNFYKPMKAKGQQIFCLKKNILNTTDGIVIMALISLGVKYKRVYPQDIHPYFYCNLNDKGKKLLKKSQKSILEYYFM